MRILWNYLTLLLYCCLFFTIALLGVGLVVSLFFSFKNEFLMCNAYYIIITVELRQAFFEDFFILSTSTRYCTFFVFLSFTPHMRFVKLLFFYQFHKLSNSYFPNKFQFIVTIVTRDTLNQTHPKEVINNTAP